MRQGTPEDGLFSITLYGIAKVDNQLAEAFYDGRIAVVVFIGANMEAWATEDGVRSPQVFSIEAVEEWNDFRVAKVEVIGVELFAGE